MNYNKPLYEVILYLTEDNRHSPYVVGGLLDLEREGFIVLKFKSMPIIFKNRYHLSNGKFSLQRKGYPWCPEIEIINIKTKKKIRVGIDLQDWTDFFSFHSFKKCDIVYKRALTVGNLKLINKIRRNFIKPFGPNYKINISDSRYIKTRKKSHIKQLFAKGLSNPNRIGDKILDWSLNRNINKKIITSHNPMVSPPKKDYIFFQVQYHDWGNNLAQSINQFRASIIRKMKNEFNDQFYGGMWFVNKVDPNYEDCMTNVDTDFSIYNSFIKNASIVISTNGFGGSIPWKLVEYMNFGCCIVSENNQHLFRQPLGDQVISNYQTPEECVALCESLLKDKALINKKKTNSIMYYNKYLLPSAVMRKIITDSMIK